MYDAIGRLPTADARPPRPGGRVISLLGDLATYYGAFWRFGILGRCPVTSDDIEMWCLFVIVQHFCFNPGHPNFRRTAHMYQTVLPDRLAAVTRPALHVCLLVGYLPLMALYPLLTALASTGDYHLALAAPFTWLDRRFRSQKDQTALGLLNTSVDLTLLAHRPGGDDLLDKTWFFEQCAPAGLSMVPCYGPSAPPALGEEVWLKPRRGGNGEGHRRSTVDAYLLAAFPSLCETHTVQALEENHPQLQEVCPGSLASLRVQMVHDGSGTLHQFAQAVLLPGRRGSIVSNVSRGGVAVLVDEAGRLQNEAIDMSGTRYQGHPDTGVRFEGHAVPFYEEAVALCRRAHLALAADLFLMGWDVAITPRGPVIHEPNLFPGLRPDLIGPEDRAAYKTGLLARLQRLYAERPPLFRTWAATRAGGRRCWRGWSRSCCGWRPAELRDQPAAWAPREKSHCDHANPTSYLSDSVQTGPDNAKDKGGHPSP